MISGFFIKRDRGQLLFYGGVWLVVRVPATHGRELTAGADEGRGPERCAGGVAGEPGIALYEAERVQFGEQPLHKPQGLGGSVLVVGHRCRIPVCCSELRDPDGEMVLVVQLLECLDEAHVIGAYVHVYADEIYAKMFGCDGIHEIGKPLDGRPAGGGAAEGEADAFQFGPQCEGLGNGHIGLTALVGFIKAQHVFDLSLCF